MIAISVLGECITFTGDGFSRVAEVESCALRSTSIRVCGPGEVDVKLRYLSPRLYLRLTLRRALLHAISPRFLHAATGLVGLRGFEPLLPSIMSRAH